ncbi:unnamed protein product [Dicrocoelium dendriticum]|nr:unnamed protein product [Dicrocoelium dendriticum]
MGGFWSGGRGRDGVRVRWEGGRSSGTFGGGVGGQVRGVGVRLRVGEGPFVPRGVRRVGWGLDGEGGGDGEWGNGGRFVRGVGGVGREGRRGGGGV